MTMVESAIEAERMQRVPGIYFMDNAPLGRVPCIIGTGLEIWEIIQVYVGGHVGGKKSWRRLRRWFDWLTPAQLRSAIAYYEAYPDEVDDRIAEEDELYEAYQASPLGPHVPPWPEPIQRVLDKWDARRRVRAAASS